MMREGIMLIPSGHIDFVRVELSDLELMVSGLQIFFLIDCSDGVAGEINKVVEAINSIVPALHRHHCHHRYCLHLQVRSRQAF